MKKTLIPILAATAVLSQAAYAGTTTKEVGATKIHGDGYKCESFETSTYLNEDQRKDLADYAILASSAYVDRNDADDGMNRGQGRVDNWKLLEDKGYRPLTKEETDTLLAGSGLNVSEVSLSGDKNKGLDYTTAVNVSGDNPDKLNIRLFEGPGNTLVVAYRGTAGVADIIDDAKQTSHLGMTPQQYKDAATALQTIVANSANDSKFQNIVCTGHSLGGGLVQYAMASTDLQGRVKGYTYNSAGLNGLQTVNSFDADLAKNAAANIIGVRNDRDPVSWVGYHLLEGQRMYEVTTEVQKGEHSIESLIKNMSATTGTNLTLPPQTNQQQNNTQQTQQNNAQQTQQTQQSGTGFPSGAETFITEQLTNNQELIDAIDDTFSEVQGWLDAVLPASAAKAVADKLEELAKQGLVSAGKAIDKAVQAQIDKLKAEILAQMPGEASKQQMSQLIDNVLTGISSGTINKTTIGNDLKNLGTSLAGDYAAKVVDGTNLPAAEKAALKKTVSDAVQAYVKGSGVVGAASTIKGNIETYVYEKVKQTMGQQTADAWKKAYETWQKGKNPWNDIKAAAKTTIETWGFKQLEKVIDKQLTKLLNNHPVLKEVFSALGIDTKSIMGTIKNIWGVLTGGGTLQQKFETLAKMAVQGLANMLKSLVKWGLGKLQAWLNGIMTKIGNFIKQWLQKLLGNKFHLPQKIIDLVLKGVDAAVKAASKAVGKVMDDKIYPAITGGIDKVVSNIFTSGKSGSKSTTTPPPANAPKVDINKVPRQTINKPQMPQPVIPGLQQKK